MELNDLLTKKGIKPNRVLVFRHRPTEPDLNKALPWLAAEKPDWFNAYQQTQPERVENAMLKRSYIASFIGHEAGKAVFVGLYTIGAHKRLTQSQFWQIPAHIEMKDRFGMKGPSKHRRSVLWFDLKGLDFYRDWKGRMVVGWPPPERSWYRKAHHNVIPITSILEESVLSDSMPPWEEIDWTWNQLLVIPTRWKVILSQWRGVYYIFDERANKGYVGSACSEKKPSGAMAELRVNRARRQQTAAHARSEKLSI